MIGNLYDIIIVASLVKFILLSIAVRSVLETVASLLSEACSKPDYAVYSKRYLNCMNGKRKRITRD